MKKFLAVLLVVLAGCITSPTSKRGSSEIISFRTIHRELGALMEEGSRLVVMDQHFVALPECLTVELIREALRKFNTQYVIEARDCDDLAVELTVKIRELFRRETHNLEAAAPAGVIGGALTGDIPELKIFMEGRIEYHAMVVVRCSGGKWYLVEPSKKLIVDLTSPIYEGGFEMFLGVF